MKDCDADYYGYRDDDDGILIPLEKEAEKEAIGKAVGAWKAEKQEKMGSDEKVVEEENIYAIKKDGSVSNNSIV